MPSNSCIGACACMCCVRYSNHHRAHAPATWLEILRPDLAHFTGYVVTTASIQTVFYLHIYFNINFMLSCYMIMRWFKAVKSVSENARILVIYIMLEQNMAETPPPKSTLNGIACMWLVVMAARALFPLLCHRVTSMMSSCRQSSCQNVNIAAVWNTERKQIMLLFTCSIIYRKRQMQNDLQIFKVCLLFLWKK